MPPVAYVYILTNKHHTVLYIGMTTDLRTRIWEHQQRINRKAFTARYNVVKPIYYEAFDSADAALDRERYLKGKTRKWKERLIARTNPRWDDLSEEIKGMNP